jgi:hypothetical protein
MNKEHNMIAINTYDIDGVIFMDEREGLRPGPDDIIITGRSYTQRNETINMLRGRGINNFVFFNPLTREDPHYSRKASGIHKAKVINHLLNCGVSVMCHFEDDPVQAYEIRTEGQHVVMIGEFNAS